MKNPKNGSLLNIALQFAKDLKHLPKTADSVSKNNTCGAPWVAFKRDNVQGGKIITFYKHSEELNRYEAIDAKGFTKQEFKEQAIAQYVYEQLEKYS